MVEVEDIIITMWMMLLMLASWQQFKNRRGQRRFWVRYWFLRRDTLNQGLLNNVDEELRDTDQFYYKIFMRLHEEEFDYILNLIGNDIMKQQTNMRDPISARQRLSLTLRYLASGETFRSLGISCRIAPNTVSGIIKETLQAIIKHLGPIYLKRPSTEEEWKQIAEEFYTTYNFPNCLGALDGKHIAFRPLRSQGSTFFNYKGFHSLVLMALVDANKRFLFVDVGANGRTSDGGVFSRSRLSAALRQDMWNFPPSQPLPGRLVKTPFVVIADSAFPLLRRLMKPYKFAGATPIQKLFNRCLSSARVVVENAFGLMANRFRVFLAPIGVHDPKYVELIIFASCILHNMLLERSPRIYELRAEEAPAELPDYEGEDGPVNEAGIHVRHEFVHSFYNRNR